MSKRNIHVLRKRANNSNKHGNNVTCRRFLCAIPPSSKQGSLSGEEGEEGAKKAREGSSDNLPIRRIEQDDDDYYDDFESSGSKNSWKRYVSYTIGTAILGLVGWASFSLWEELFGRGSPGSLFNETFEKVRYNDEILLMTGGPMKAYGQDSGRRSEGRRNHVANRYVFLLVNIPSVPNLCLNVDCLLYATAAGSMKGPMAARERAFATQCLGPRGRPSSMPR